MTKKFKRAYIEYNEWNNTYSVAITKVTVEEDFGERHEIDEDEVKRIGGFDSIDEAREYIKTDCKKIAEIIEE